MIRTKTTLIVGAGASCELQMPSGAELLNRFAQGFDFSRVGTASQTRDGMVLGQHLGRLAERLGESDEAVLAAADRIRFACRLAPSVDGLLGQYADDPLVGACLKLGIVHFIAQAEAKSILRLTPRTAGDLPIQGTDTWLFQLAQLITSGVPRARIERCFADLSIVCFNYDRSIEHFLPHALVMAHGMDLAEAQDIVAGCLRIIHPYGTIGRLPWQPGEDAELEWAVEQPSGIEELAAGIRSAGEVARDRATLGAIRTAVANSERLVFLGFGFQAQNVELLIDHPFGHEPDILATVADVAPPVRDMIGRMLRRRTGARRDDQVMLFDQRCHELMRDYALVLES